MENSYTSGLCIDISAVRHNYRTINKLLEPQTTCGVVIKANAYGVGMEACAEAFYAEGCRLFFVASLDEALELKSILQNQNDINIAVFHGLGGLSDGASLDAFAKLGLIPVLNSLHEIELWQAVASKNNTQYSAMLHIDTGMERLGLTNQEFQTFLNNQDKFTNINWYSVMSHLACADDPENPMTERQYQDFLNIKASFPDISASLANSAGVFYDAKLHFDIERVGAAMSGFNPCNTKIDIKPVMFLHTPILNIHHVLKGSTVGYGATHTCKRNTVIATIPVGYADGYLRSAGNKSSVWVNGTKCSVIGRISMDLITIDITDIAEQTKLGDLVEILGQNQTVDSLAKDAGSIGYEILTSIGKNHSRTYTTMP